MSRTTLAIAFAAGIAFGSLLTWLLSDAPEPSRRVTATSRESTASDNRNSAQNEAATDCREVISPGQELDQELHEVAGLRQKLSDRLDALQASQAENSSTGGRGAYELQVCREALESLEPESVAKRLNPNRERDTAFDVDQLADLGFSELEVEYLRDRWEEAKMAKLTLANKLARGERLDPGETYTEIDRRLREDLGDDDYGAMLYATNQKNAVAFQSVYESSQAYDAGIRGGRVIHSYNGTRVFRPMELEALIRETRSGEMVAVEVVTNDGLERIWVKSELIGVNFGAVPWDHGRQ